MRAHDKTGCRIGRSEPHGAERCPRFEKCSANVCPVDPDWRLRTHLDGERVCLYLTEQSKPGGRAILAPVLSSDLLEEVARAVPEIIARYGPIRRAADRAARTPSRVARAEGLRSWS